jgi:pimeloyl-ACP methyl ester carboxylesterase
VQISLHDVAGQIVRVGVRPGRKTAPPLLLFNGIGASIELVEPFLAAFDGPEVVVFDVPGVGGSPAPRLPYGPSTLSLLSARLLDQLGHAQVDVLGVSWGGALAQQFAFQQGRRCRRLVLAATSPGHLMVPGKLTTMLRMATPRRYKDPDYMTRVAGDLYGGAFRASPELARASSPCPLVERLRLLSAVDRRRRLDQPALASFPSPAHTGDGGKRRSDRTGRQRAHPGKANSARAARDHQRRPFVSAYQRT